MSKILSVGIVQTDLKWKDKIHNLNTIEQIIASSESVPNIVLLPEMFNTGFCVDDLSLAEDSKGQTIAWMQNIANQYQTAISGSILFNDNGNYYNRLFFISPTQNINYNKRHLFSLVDEDKLLTKGTEKVVISYNDWKIEPFICYDLRFPEWCSNKNNVALQFFVANWPHKRIAHWNHLLQARAIENQCFVVGINRVGNDYFGNEHHGYSCVYDFKGNELMLFKDLVGMKIVDLHLDDWIAFRAKYPFYKDR
ncbi:MAG: nitrilase family protein [Chitinophagales bacterium]|nr:nitrilase family protein [Chitinophagales bacterium]